MYTVSCNGCGDSLVTGSPSAVTTWMERHRRLKHPEPPPADPALPTVVANDDKNTP